jgi:hypothetical protein
LGHPSGVIDRRNFLKTTVAATAFFQACRAFQNDELTAEEIAFLKETYDSDIVSDKSDFFDPYDDENIYNNKDLEKQMQLPASVEIFQDRIKKILKAYEYSDSLGEYLSDPERPWIRKFDKFQKLSSFGVGAHLADDSFHPDYDQATARAETIVDDVRKKERNKRLKSVGFAAGMIVVPTLLSRVADHFGIIDWIKDRHWNPGEWKFSDGTPTKPVVDRSFVVYTPHGAENVLPLIGTNSVNTDALASMGRLFNASGATPWARAHEFMGSATGARDWLNQAVARTPGASWHNLGDGIAANDWISINGNSDTAFVWDKLTRAMLTP